MKIRLIFILFILSFLISCGKKNKECWNIEFKTAYSDGICYYIDSEEIFTTSGELAFHNKSNVPVHLFIFNDTINGKLEYEADLDLGGILSYPNLDQNNNYTVGVRVLDGKGSQDVNIAVYSNFDLIYPE